MKNLKTYGISAVVALVVGLVVASFATPVSNPVVSAPQKSVGATGGATYTNVDNYANGLQVGDAVTFWKIRSLGAGVNQASWRNTTGRTVYVDYSELTTSGTASTSFIWSVGTSTTATSTDVLNTGFTPNLQNITIATSSIATTTAVLNDNPVLPVANGQYLVGKLEAINGTAGSEAATSTNRGFNMTWRIRAHYQQ